MNRRSLALFLLAALLPGWPVPARAAEEPYGKGLSEANEERLVLEDVADISDWYNGSPEETTLSVSGRHSREGRPTLLFANRVDHTTGEKNYPIGWPRTGKNLAKQKLTDWSAYDRFECWVYAETSRESLPKTPLALGFYHSGQRRSSHVRLPEVKKDNWVKVAIPLSKLIDPTDVQRMQWNISESDYAHGDQVDFYIDRPALVRYVQPAVAELEMDRKLVFSDTRVLRARFKLVGYKGLETTRVQLAVGRVGEAGVAEADGPATPSGDLAVPIRQPLPPGRYWASLQLRDADGKLIDRCKVEFRVIAGPFKEQ